MEERLRTNRTGIAAGVVSAIAVLAVAALFDLGPFADDELSAAEFLSRGDEVCREAHDEFLDIQRSAPRTASDAEAIAEALIEVAEEETAALRELDPPAGLATRLESYLDEREQGIELLRTGLAAAQDEDVRAYEAAQAKLARTQPKRLRAARKVGFSECSEPLSKPAELERQAQPPAGV